jgi:hypothetical protein
VLPPRHEKQYFHPVAVHHKSSYDAPMPTKNPRLSITFKPSFAARLRRLSELTGSSQGALAAEFLEGAVPAIDRLIRLIEAAQGAKADVLQKLQSDLEEAQGRVETQLGIVLDDSDRITASLLDKAEEIPRRAGRAGVRKRSASPVAAPVTPPSNRGVRSTAKTHRTTS